VRVQVAGGLARARAETIDAPAAEHRDQRGVQQKRNQHEGERPADRAQDGEHGQRDEHGDQRRRDGVGEEVLDQLDVVRGHAHQVAGAAAREIGGRQRVELAEHREPHVGSSR
jgi:hypothetical protein